MVFPGTIRCLAFSPDGALLAAAGTPLAPEPGVRGLVLVWQVSQQRLVRRLVATGRLPTPAAMACLAFSPGGDLVAAGVNRRIFVWRRKTGALLAALAGHDAPINALAFSPNAETLASGSQDRTVKLWNMALRQEVATMTGYERFITCVAFSPDGNVLAVGSNDQSVVLLRAATMAEIRRAERKPAGSSLPLAAGATSPE